MTNVTLPKEAWVDLDEGTEALLDEWLVKDGDDVEQSQLIARVMLVKSTYEVTAPAAGKISIKTDAGSYFNAGTILAEIG